MLPSGLGQINYNHSVFAQLIIIGSNWVLGILALLALVWEVYNLIKILWDSGRGKKTEYTHRILKIGGLPDTASALLDIFFTLVVLGFVISGAWVSLADRLIGVGQHITTVVTNTIGNSTGNAVAPGNAVTPGNAATPGG
ncbi:hypothetical protein TPY_2676 [Sulfobacillus acidophilus TPY]|uniref:Uncharacterized protein n=1 Tax=Sulfobacillus acidophilus (strain ATCC 700253 / DSM 10332 / NAL) TaxID=679936 RepID=G8TV64_SULAD|nr:hypothetical protein TPY_2676 [Sulfobacillus acidophilus TPY]AEW04704.1 hypothetical protein Sulac_1204 [Sulfobacillus acidophilus DSM 10332]